MDVDLLKEGGFNIDYYKILKTLFKRIYCATEKLARTYKTV